MQKVFFLFLAIVIVEVLSQERLIQLNSSYTVWMSEEEVTKLSSECGVDHGFMDITEYPVIERPNTILATYPTATTQSTRVNPLLGNLKAENLRAFVTKLSSYTTRYYTSATGIESAQWIASQYRGIATGKSGITVVEFKHSAWPTGQPSVIATITGTGPKANERVIIGAHIDSTSNGNRAPGADDNASGSANVLEVFRVLVESGFKPDRTLEFHGYAAEEVGLRGSQDIANKYATDGVNVYAMLNMDMTAYVKPGTTESIGVEVTDTNVALTNFLRIIVTRYIPPATSTPHGNTACGYACSDHASFTRAGFPASRLSETSNRPDLSPYIHTVNDVISHLNFNHALTIAKAALAFAVECSNAP